MKPHKAGHVLCDQGYYQTIVEARVDTIEVEDAICYKYRVYDQLQTGRNYRLAFEIYIGEELIQHTTCHKFMTKTQFKELLNECLVKHMKNSLNIK